MKDYYYFLGVNDDASEEDIKRAYRKLSLKYHPDKNEEDEFFNNRFREIQEAYEVLIDPDKRKTFDENLDRQKRSFRTNLPPSIKTFHANKLRVVKGEEVSVKWNTQNADVVKILPFGLEKAFGERIFKINEFTDGKFTLLCYATNSMTHKTAVQAITITEVFKSDNEKFREEVEEMFEHEPEAEKEVFNNAKLTKIVFGILLLIFAILILSKIYG